MKDVNASEPASRRSSSFLLHLSYFVALLLLILVTLACFHPLVRQPRGILVGPQNGGLNDLTWYFIAWRNYPRICLDRFGQPPWWNPYSSCGVPYAGNPQAGLLYPPNWLCWWFDARDVLSWMLVGHHWLAGVGTYVLCRRYGFQSTSSLLGGVAFLAAPYLVAHSGEGHYAQVAAVAWMPWALWAYERLRAGARGGVAGLAAVLAISFFCGHLQETFYLGIVLTAFWMVDLVQRVRSDGGAAAGRLLGAWPVLGATVAGLVMVDLLPIFLYSRQMVRSGGFDSTAAGSISVGPMNLFQLLNPMALGSAANYAGPGRFYWETVCSFGLVPLVLAIVGVAQSWRRYPVPRMAVGWLVALAFAFGSGSPVFELMHRLVPGVSMFRSPSRAFFFSSLATAVLAAAALDWLLTAAKRTADESKRVARRILLAAGCIVLAVCISIGVVVQRQRATQAATNDSPAASAPSDSRGSSPAAMQSVLLGRAWQRTLGSGTTWLWFGGSLALILAATRWPERARCAAAGLIALCVAELSLHGGRLVAVLPAASLSQSGPVATLTDGESGIFRAMASQYLLSDLQSWEHGVQKVHGYDPVPLARYVTFVAALADKSDPMSAVLGFSSLNVATYRPELLNLLNVRFAALTRTPPDAFGWQLKGQGTFTPPNLTQPSPNPIRFTSFENPHALPRAFVIGHVQSIAPGQDAAALLRSLNPREAVILERDVLPIGERQDYRPADVVEYTPNRVTIDAELDKPGYLILTDTWFPGWTARLSDAEKPLTVLPANVAFRAVPLDAGRHRVTFTFQPPGLLLGAFVSLSALFVLLGSLLIPLLPSPQNRDLPISVR